jgi:hypothetical protein
MHLNSCTQTNLPRYPMRLVVLLIWGPYKFLLLINHSLFDCNIAFTGQTTHMKLASNLHP